MEQQGATHHVIAPMLASQESARRATPHLDARRTGVQATVTYLFEGELVALPSTASGTSGGASSPARTSA
jgi:hypothetical protein